MSQVRCNTLLLEICAAAKACIAKCELIAPGHSDSEAKPDSDCTVQVCLTIVNAIMHQLMRLGHACQDSCCKRDL